MPAVIARKRFTVDDYHRMGHAGILRAEDRVELIDGEVVTMTPIGPPHNAAIARINLALVHAINGRAIVNPQGSVRLDRYGEPQPDFAVLRLRGDFYAARHAGPDDIFLIIEVADSSLEYDRTVKSRIYADAGVPEYWLVDLTGGVVTRFAEPRDGTYQRATPHHPGEVLAPELLPECTIAVATLLGV